MLYKLGRGLQLLGLIILPVAVMGNVAEQMNLRESLEISAIGIMCFLIGWLLQQLGRPR